MSIAVNTNTTAAYQAYSSNSTSTASSQPANTSTTVPQDEVILSGQTPQQAQSTAKTYGKPANPELIAKLKEEAETSHKQLKQMVEGLMYEQGIKWGDVIRGKATLTADPETIKQAQADIADDGYYGVEKTSERILEFAKALIGDDISKLPMIRDAVEEGFAAVKKIFGLKPDENLPEVSMKTYDKIMAEFDSWEAAGAIPPAKQN